MLQSAEHRQVWLQVSGFYACFTRPEMKVERVSYEVMTPSAARGILESILWKPALRWEVERIGVLKPIQWCSVRRNEVESLASLPRLKNAWAGHGPAPGVWIEDERVQRSSLVLKDVSYMVQARFSLSERAGPRDNLEKFASMFERRARRGQCFNQPYLGCREFSAQFEYREEGDFSQTLNIDKDLGWMLYDLDYRHKDPQPQFFRAELRAGVLEVPPACSEELRS